MRLNRPNNSKKDEYGRVYVYTLDLEDGTKLWKVGMCESSRTVDRMMEVLTSFFKVYRYVPHTRLRLDKKTLVPRLLEKHMHELLDEYRYDFDKKFDGRTEMFTDLDEDTLLDYLRNKDDLDFLQTDKLEIKYYDILAKESKRRLQEKVNDKVKKFTYPDEVPF